MNTEIHNNIYTEDLVQVELHKLNVEMFEARAICSVKENQKFY